MKVQRITLPNGENKYILLDKENNVVMSVKNYIKFLDSIGKSENTIKNYCHSLKLYFEFLEINKLSFNDFGDSNLIDQLSLFIKRLKYKELNLKITPIENVQTRSNNTINSIISIVINFYEHYYRIEQSNDSFLRKNTTFNSDFKGFLHELVRNKSEIKSNIFKLKSKKRKIKTITNEDYELMLENCLSYRDKFLVSLLYESGIRIGEALGLFLEDIEVWENKINITKRENHLNKVSVKNCSEGTIEVPSYVFEFYTSYITEEFLDTDSDYVFVNLRGKNKGLPIKPITVEKLFERLSEKIEKKVTPHMLRHTHATNLIEIGNWDPIDVRDRLRHTNIQTTISTYIHTSDNYKKEKYKEYLKQTGGLEND